MSHTLTTHISSTGQPLAGANIYWLAPSYLKRTVASLPKHGLPSRVDVELLQSGLSDAQGRFSLQAQLDSDDRRIADRMTLIIAKAPKHGFGGTRYGSDTKNVEVTLSEEIPIEGRENLDAAAFDRGFVGNWV